MVMANINLILGELQVTAKKKVLLIVKIFLIRINI